MVRDPFGREDEADLEDVLHALDDPDCRTIIVNLERPMTAKELSDTIDVPLSTLYRKLELLSDASLLEEGTEIRRSGQHATRYEIAFDEVAIALEEDHTLGLSISRPARTADERLAQLWSEVRQES